MYQYDTDKRASVRCSASWGLYRARELSTLVCVHGCPQLLEKVIEDGLVL